MHIGVKPSPDPAFVKSLHEFDPKLIVRFDRMAERFVILKDRAFGKPWVIMVIEDDFGGFRQPDRRDVQRLWEGDLWRHGGVDERIKSGEEKIIKAHQDSEVKADTEIREQTKDDGRYLRKQIRQIANIGKANSDVRRVDLNQKGYTAEQLSRFHKQGIDPWANTKTT